MYCRLSIYCIATVHFPRSTVYKLNLAVIEAGNRILDEGLQFNYKSLFVSL